MDARAVLVASGRPRLESALIESLPHRVECELAGVSPPRLVMLEQVIDEARLSAETGEQCNIDVASLPRLAPPLHCDSPATPMKDALLLHETGPRPVSGREWHSEGRLDQRVRVESHIL